MHGWLYFLGEQSFRLSCPYAGTSCSQEVMLHLTLAVSWCLYLQDLSSLSVISVVDLYTVVSPIDSLF